MNFLEIFSIRGPDMINNTRKIGYFHRFLKKICQKTVFLAILAIFGDFWHENGSNELIFFLNSVSQRA